MTDVRLSLHVYRPKTIDLWDQDRIVKSSNKTESLLVYILKGVRQSDAADIFGTTQVLPVVK